MGGNADDGAALWREACDEAVLTLRDALEWVLPEPSWEHILAAVSEIAQAVAAASPELLFEATSQLELCGPRRIVERLGAADKAPLQAREQITALVQTLTPDSEPTSGDSTRKDAQPRS